MRAGGQQTRIFNKRRSYKQSNRRQRADNNEILETEGSSEEEVEGYESKLVRLRREVMEVKAEAERRKAENQAVSKKEPEADSDDLDALRHVLEDIDLSSRQKDSQAAGRLIQKINSASDSRAKIEKGVATKVQQQPAADAAYILNYAPNYSKDHTIARIADFDARLTLLETILGAEAIPLETQDRADAKPILPALDSLQRQISLVSKTSDSSLDSASRRVKQLTKDVEKLTEARKASKAAQDAMNDGESSIANVAAASQNIEDPERTSKINALYGTLPTIESLSPLLPPLLDRLRSLRSVHADATNASQSLADAERRQQAMAEELRNWREGLEKVEGVIKQSEQTMSGNMSTVDGWVKELEDRMQRLAG